MKLQMAALGQRQLLAASVSTRRREEAFGAMALPAKVSLLRPPAKPGPGKEPAKSEIGSTVSRLALPRFGAPPWHAFR